MRDDGKRRVWAVVLAGGDGERMRDYVSRWLGTPLPKQYCAFVGTRSMFQHTVDRALALAPAERVVTVVAGSHAQEALTQLEGRPIQVLLQPENRGTGAGIFLPLAYIRARDPEATVVILPSDHFVYPEERFLEVIEQVTRGVAKLPEHAVLLGVTPDRPESDYGWIVPGPTLDAPRPGHTVRAVSRFLEKPSPRAARAAMRAGGVWNTLVLTAPLELLWTLGWSCFPDMMPLMEHVTRTVRLADRLPALSPLYAHMPRHDFSSELLTPAAGHLAVVEATEVLWSDWGRPQRIGEMLRALDLEPGDVQVPAVAAVADGVTRGA